LKRVPYGPKDIVVFKGRKVLIDSGFIKY